MKVLEFMADDMNRAQARLEDCAGLAKSHHMDNFAADCLESAKDCKDMAVRLRLYKEEQDAEDSQEEE
jgi:hypothetical protein